jgi:hypothetical protein
VKEFRKHSPSYIQNRSSIFSIKLEDCDLFEFFLIGIVIVERREHRSKESRLSSYTDALCTGGTMQSSAYARSDHKCALHADAKAAYVAVCEGHGC